jgi:hypothetical protein
MASGSIGSVSLKKGGRLEVSGESGVDVGDFMTDPLEQSIKLGFDPAVGVGALDHRRHHRVRVGHQPRIADHLEQRAHPEHVAPQTRGFRGLRGLLLTVAEHGEPHGVV